MRVLPLEVEVFREDVRFLVHRADTPAVAGVEVTEEAIEEALRVSTST